MRSSNATKVKSGRKRKGKGRGIGSMEGREEGKVEGRGERRGRWRRKEKEKERGCRWNRNDHMWEVCSLLLVRSWKERTGSKIKRGKKQESDIKRRVKVSTHGEKIIKKG